MSCIFLYISVYSILPVPSFPSFSSKIAPRLGYLAAWVSTIAPRLGFSRLGWQVWQCHCCVQRWHINHPQRPGMLFLIFVMNPSHPRVLLKISTYSWHCKATVIIFIIFFAFVIFDIFVHDYHDCNFWPLDARKSPFNAQFPMIPASKGDLRASKGAFEDFEDFTFLHLCMIVISDPWMRANHPSMHNFQWFLHPRVICAHPRVLLKILKISLFCICAWL